MLPVLTSDATDFLRCRHPERRVQHRFRLKSAVYPHFEGCIARLTRAQFRGMKMSKIKTLAVAGATAMALVVVATSTAPLDVNETRRGT